MPVAEFRFFRQVGGRGQFGRVQVHAEPHPHQVHVHLDHAVQITSNDHALPPTDPDAMDWAQGALQGCQDALEFAEAQGVCTGGTARILGIHGAIVDTGRESIRIAALMATWNALTDSQDPLTMTFHDGRWSVART